MTADRVIAIVHDYDGLVAALRARVAEFGVSAETIDDLAGIATRYTSKLLAPIPIKGLGRVSLGPMLGALGLKIIVVEDTEALRLVVGRLKRKAEQYARTGMHAHESHINRGDSAWGRRLSAHWMIKTSQHQRTRNAKRAAMARWRKQSRSGRGDSSS